MQTTKDYVISLLTFLGNLFSLIMQALSLPPEYLNVRRMSLDNLEYEASQHLVHSRSLSLLGESIEEAAKVNHTPQSKSPSTQQSTMAKSNSFIELSSSSNNVRTCESDEEDETSIIPEFTCENIEVIIPLKLKERLSISSLKSCKSESCLQLADIHHSSNLREEPDETPKGRREPPPQFLKLPSVVTVEKSLPQDKFHQHLMKKTFVLKKSFSENHSSIELHNRLQTFKFPPSSSTSELCNYD